MEKFYFQGKLLEGITSVDSEKWLCTDMRGFTHSYDKHTIEKGDKIITIERHGVKCKECGQMTYPNRLTN